MDITCEECGSGTFHVSELVWGCLTLFCEECNHKIPLADEGQVYANFGSGTEYERHH